MGPMEFFRIPSDPREIKSECGLIGIKEPEF